MINPFNISSNDRYTLNGRTIIIEEVLTFSVIWYYLDEWWNRQKIYPNLHKTSKINIMLLAEKYKYA